MRNNGNSSEKRATTNVPVERALARRIRKIATHRGVTMSEVLVRYAGKALDREYRRVAEETNAELGGEGGA